MTIPLCLPVCLDAILQFQLTMCQSTISQYESGTIVGPKIAQFVGAVFLKIQLAILPPAIAQHVGVFLLSLQKKLVLILFYKVYLSLAADLLLYPV